MDVQYSLGDKEAVTGYHIQMHEAQQIQKSEVTYFISIFFFLMSAKYFKTVEPRLLGIHKSRSHVPDAAIWLMPQH